MTDDNAIPLPIEDSMVSSLDVLTTKEDGWDRIATVLGFWDLRGIELNTSTGTRRGRARICGSGWNVGAFGATNVRAVAAGRGRCATPNRGPGMTCRRPRITSR